MFLCLRKSAQTCVAYTCQFHLSLSFEYVMCSPVFPPQVLQVSMAWLGMAGTAREDLRGHQERPVTPGRQDLQVSRDIVRQPCAWLHQRTLPQGYRRQEQLKDPIFRSIRFPSATLKLGIDQERETTLLSRTTARVINGEKQQGLCTVLHQFCKECDTLLS